MLRREKVIRIFLCFVEAGGFVRSCLESRGENICIVGFSGGSRNPELTNADDFYDFPGFRSLTNTFLLPVSSVYIDCTRSMPPNRGVSAPSLTFSSSICIGSIPIQGTNLITFGSGPCPVGDPALERRSLDCPGLGFGRRRRLSWPRSYRADVEP
jgi:hypothetical protein